MLDAKDFTQVASGGFGDPHNGLAWSMEWFKGRLYVGTLRDLLWLFKKVGNYPYLDPYPVPLPPLAEMDLRAQIWRYTPEAESWARVYTSPLITPSLRRPAGPFPWRRLLGAPRILRMLRRQGRQRRATVLIRALLGFGLEWARAGFRMQVARDMGYRNMAYLHRQARGRGIVCRRFWGRRPPVAHHRWHCIRGGHQPQPER